MIRQLAFVLLAGCTLGHPVADHTGGYGAPHSSGYGAPSSGYAAPAPSYHGGAKNEVVHIHHHHYDDNKGYSKPSYKPSYEPQPYHSSSYHSNSGYHSSKPFYDDDEYIHLHKEELTRSALLLGAGIVKGVILTGLINNSNNGITIGKK